MTENDNLPNPHTENETDSQQVFPRSIAVQMARFGPLPPADEFESYEMTTPGAGDRIISMAEEEQKHRQKMELKAFELQKENANRDHELRSQLAKDEVSLESQRIIIGFFIVFLCLIAGVIFGIMGMTAGVISAIVSPVTVVVIYVLCRKTLQSKNTSK